MVSLLEQYETETQQTNDDFDPDLSNPVSQLYFFLIFQIGDVIWNETQNELSKYNFYLFSLFWTCLLTLTKKWLLFVYRFQFA